MSLSSNFCFSALFEIGAELYVLAGGVWATVLLETLAICVLDSARVGSVGKGDEMGDTAFVKFCTIGLV